MGASVTSFLEVCRRADGHGLHGRTVLLARSTMERRSPRLRGSTAVPSGPRCTGRWHVMRAAMQRRLRPRGRTVPGNRCATADRAAVYRKRDVATADVEVVVGCGYRRSKSTTLSKSRDDHGL
jgi:hypothetical protein